jgi:hypothetical protein
VYAAAVVLAERMFIVIDEITEEVLIRSHIKHDGVIKVPNSAAAMCTAMASVASSTLRAVMVFELRKLFTKSPDLAGWTGGTSGEKLRAILAREALDPGSFPTGFPVGGDRIAPPSDDHAAADAGTGRRPVADRRINPSGNP